MTKQPQYFYNELYLGPRRDAVGKVESDMRVEAYNMDVASDREFGLEPAVWEEAREKYIALRVERDRLLTCHIHQIEGAAEFFQRADAERKIDNEA